MTAPDPALVERVARARVTALGFGWYDNPMEGGQDAYDICQDALAEADWWLSETLAALRESGRLVEWRPIAEAETDGTVYTVWVEGRDGLPPFVSHCAYHPNAGWCADELREVTHYLVTPAGPATAATEGE